MSARAQDTSQQRAAHAVPIKTFSLNHHGCQNVVRGYVDVFLVHRDGPRAHLLRVEAGGCLLGLGPAVSGERSVLAVLGPDAEIETGANEVLGASAAEVWIEALTRKVAPKNPPTRTDLLVPGSITAMDSKPVTSRAALVWVMPLQGKSYFLGRHDLPPIESGTWFPLSASGWIEPAEAMQFQAADVEQIVLDDHRFQAFHRLVQLLWNYAAEERDQRDHARALRQGGADRLRMQEALRHLAAPLSAGDLPASEGMELPWLACCKRIGAVSEIQFVAAPGHESTSQDDIIQAISRASGARSRRVLLAEGWWKQEHEPLLAQRSESKSPVAVVFNRGHSWIFDPCTGAETLATAEAAAGLEPFGTAFYRPFPEGPVKAAGLLAFALSGVRQELIGILLTSFATAAIAMVLPVATGYVFDRVLPPSHRSQLDLIAALLGLIAIGTALFDWMRGALLLRMEGRMDKSVQAALWSRLLDLPPAFFRRFSAGDLATRGLGIQAMREVLTGTVITSLLSGIFSLVSLGVLFFYNVRLAMVASLLTTIAFAVVTACGYLMVRRQRDLATVQGRLSGLALQMMYGISKIRIAAAEPRAYLTWARLYGRQTEEQLASRRLGNWVLTFNALWLPLCTALIFAVYLAALADPSSTNTMTTGDFVGFLSAFAVMLRGCLGFSAALIGVLSVAPAYERALPILEATAEAGAGRTPPGPLHGAIHVDRVCLRYLADGPLAVNNVSLSIRPGEFVAFVGASGSGKSSLLRLLLGFEEPESGSILFDGKDLAYLDPQLVRKQIGVVLQGGRIAAGSIIDNISGSLEVTAEEAWEAARMAGFEADIQNMPMGMQTVLGEGGGTLSGGQRQRLLIARALLKKPRILFFDEATSALDNHTQATVSRSLEQLDATRVVIAHRLSTIERADRIYVIDRGRLVQQGTYQELSAVEGPFADLARRQIV
jgi:NHLM bacteriocin system ABC transporter ATP-binding protein